MQAPRDREIAGCLHYWCGVSCTRIFRDWLYAGYVNIRISNWAHSTRRNMVSG